MEVVRHIVDSARGKHPLRSVRSARWPAVRKRHLALHPVCAVCGGAEALEVHHILPFHVRPDLELDPGNLVTLCEAKRAGVNCHLFVGHLGSYRSHNVAVREDAAAWRSKLQSRPGGGSKP